MLTVLRTYGSLIPAAFRVAQLRRLYNLVANLIMCEEQGERDRVRFRALDDAEMVE